MTPSFDPTGDFGNVADFQREVTLLRPGTSESWSLGRAVAAAVRASEARSSSGRYTEDDVVWHLDASELTTAPQPADIVLDSDERRWVVLASRRTVVGRWRCVCRSLAILHSLDQYIDIEAAVYTKDATGAEIVTWHPWRTGVAARVQPIRTTVENRHNRCTQITELKVYVADRFEVDHGHRVKAPDGVVYQIIGSQKADRIDALMEIDVVCVGGQ